MAEVGLVGGPGTGGTHDALTRSGRAGPTGIRPVALASAALALAVGAIPVGIAAGSPLTHYDGVVTAVVAALAGALVARARAGNPVGWFLLWSAFTQGAAEACLQLSLLEVGPAAWLAWSSAPLRAVAAMLLFVFVPLHFPDGRLPGRSWRWVRRGAIATTVTAAVWVALRPGVVQMTAQQNPLADDGAATLAEVLGVVTTGGMLLLLAAAVAALTVRYRRGTRTERAQVKWLGLAAGIVLGAIVVSYPAEAIDARLFAVADAFVALGAAASPAVVGLALLRHHLHDVDAVISRTVVYAVLTIAVVLTYVIAVVYLGALLQARGSLLVSLLATGLVAVAFSPLRERLQSAVDRLLYGDRGAPHAALDRLAGRLEDAASIEDLLQIAATEVATALRAPYVAIEVMRPEGRVVLASHGGPPAGRCLRTDCVADGRPVGAVVLGPFVGGGLTGAERRLLDTLLRPIGAAIRRQQLAADLARSREALVAAREEERARLHRDLHDGLGPELATVSMLAEAAGAAIADDPDHASALLDTLVDRAQSAVGDLRTLVYGLRPPALDTVGLVDAVRAYADVHTTSRTSVVVGSGPLPPLSPAVEVAAYRIAVEAVTNVARHADATSCSVRLWSDDRHLHLEVRDDGRGVTGTVAGVGVRSMEGRATELGGWCTVTTHAAGGTVVHATLPRGHTDEPRPTPVAAP